MSADKKIYLFEYMIKKIVDKYKELKSVETDSEAYAAFSKLKLIKLNFFVSAVDANEDNSGLLDIFNNFYAMPYGHVESDIYNGIQEGKLEFFILSEASLSEKSSFVPKEDFKSEELRIDNAIDSLLKKNVSFFDYTAFQLVELSHEWYSWRLVFDIAQRNGKLSSLIPSKIIKSEEKFFKVPDYAVI